MSTKTVAEQPVTKRMTRPGLLVEDRNAAVRRTPEGDERITKVPSRQEEARRQGVEESAI